MLFLNGEVTNVQDLGEVGPFYLRTETWVEYEKRWFSKTAIRETKCFVFGCTFRYGNQQCSIGRSMVESNVDLITEKDLQDIFKSVFCGTKNLYNGFLEEHLKFYKSQTPELLESYRLDIIKKFKSVCAPTNEIILEIKEIIKDFE